MDFLIPYCVACGKKHQPGPCAVATADLTRYAEVPLDTPEVKPVKVDFSKLTKAEVEAAFPCAKDKNTRCDKRAPDRSNWFCSRPLKHDGPHVGYEDHTQRGGAGPSWNDGDTTTVTPRSK